MDRLGEIKNMDFDSEFGGEEFEWLISEIERLKKEKEWLIEEWAKDKHYINNLWAADQHSMIWHREKITDKMQQALKGDGGGGEEEQVSI